ncbi:hypothetical protein ACN38_g11801 [Penicillium nordicum]|uniref:Uncharacterized protein n=1 Tax=Penicillium nordicum TaxID=229535 RepID=A0A0N0RXI2_9EURO|nr:hypothetical protein ACN38_g11801 [Penicillium nordicum]
MTSRYVCSPRYAMILNSSFFNYSLYNSDIIQIQFRYNSDSIQIQFRFNSDSSHYRSPYTHRLMLYQMSDIVLVTDRPLTCRLPRKEIG